MKEIRQIILKAITEFPSRTIDERRKLHYSFKVGTGKEEEEEKKKVKILSLAKLSGYSG